MNPERLRPVLDWMMAFNGPFLRSLIFVVLVALAQALIGRGLSRARFLSQDTKLRSKVALRNIALLVVLVGVGAIWAEQVQSVLLSVVAVGATAAIAVKELLMCLAGGLLRTTTTMFSVGDRIEVNGFRGDVIDVGPLTTTLLEVGPGKESHQWTGRSVSLPNSIFLLQPTMNESYTDEWVLHPFLVVIPRSDDWQAAETALLAAAHELCAPFLEEARQFMERRARRHSLATMNVDPRVTLRLGDPTRIELLVRIPVPHGQRGRLEQAILRRFLESTRPAPKEPVPAPPPPEVTGPPAA
jgi:small-conductance mechanosensitive channel